VPRKKQLAAPVAASMSAAQPGDVTLETDPLQAPARAQPRHVQRRLADDPHHRDQPFNRTAPGPRRPRSRSPPPPRAAGGRPTGPPPPRMDGRRRDDAQGGAPRRSPPRLRPAKTPAARVLQRLQHRKNPQPTDQPQPDAEPEPESSEMVRLPARKPSQRTLRRMQREARLLAIAADVDDTSVSAPPLAHTPSALADIQEAAVDYPFATDANNQRSTRAQRLRKHLRVIDAEIAEVNAELARVRALSRGASGETFTCDGDMIVGGCGEETFTADQGVLCGGCKLFLCYRCFGASVIRNECQVTGRFDKTVDGGDHNPSEPGSVPCPLFPQACSCGHIPLRDVQEALLHPDNRGPDGPEEDVNSPGNSPHKVHLQARRRQAEAEAQAAKDASGDGGGTEDESVELVRSFTDRIARSTNAALARAGATNGSLVGFAEKLEELDELKAELARTDLAAVSEIDPRLRRRCVQCNDELVAFEGAACQNPDHFLCAVCFGGYLMRACSPGGVFEQEITDEQGTVVSVRGGLPCPFFQHLDSHLVPRLGRQQRLGLNGAAMDAEDPNGATSLTSASLPALPPMECHCGALPMREIETVLLDPRNNSFAFWRHRYADAVVWSHSDSTTTVEAAPRDTNQLPPGWVTIGDQSSGYYYYNVETDEVSSDRPVEPSREAEVLRQGYTPANVHETARLRVAIVEENISEQKRLEAIQEQREQVGPEDRKLAELREQVIDALTRGGTMRCPQCGKLANKDDACIHIDSCDCGSSWCYLCGKERSECPRGAGRGGCDEQGYYLQHFEGWKNFAIAANGESAAAGAQFEFLRRRQAFMVKTVMWRADSADPTLWPKLREKEPALLSDTPTPGRNIDWDSLGEADMPLFGGNLRRERERPDPEAARRRMEQMWERERLEQMHAEWREAQRWRRQMCTIPLWAILTALLVIVTTLLFDTHPPSNPAILVLPEEGNSTDPLALYPDSQAADSQNSSVVLPDAADSQNSTNQRLCEHEYTITPVSAQQPISSRTERGVMRTCAIDSSSLHAPCTSLVWRVPPAPDDDWDVVPEIATLVAARSEVLQPAQSLLDCQEWCRQSTGCSAWQFHCDDSAWSSGPAATCAAGACVLKNNALPTEDGQSPTTEVLMAGAAHVYESACMDERPEFECRISCMLLRWVPVVQLAVIAAMLPWLLANIRGLRNFTDGAGMAVLLTVAFVGFFAPRNVVLDLFTSNGENLLDLGWFSAYFLVPFFGMTGAGKMMVSVALNFDRAENEMIDLTPGVMMATVVVFAACMIDVRAAIDQDLIGTVETTGTFEFDCSWTCESTVWIPRVVALIGGIGHLMWALRVCHRGHFRAVAYASAFAGSVFLWVAWVDPVEFVYMSSANVYILAPFCLWVNMMWAASPFVQLFESGFSETLWCAFCNCCIGCGLLIYYIIAMVSLRSANETLIIPAAPQFEFACDDEWCLWLWWSPRWMAAVGAVSLVITGLCAACGRGRGDRDEYVTMFLFAAGTWVTFLSWPLLVYHDPKSLLEANGAVAYGLLPIFCGAGSTVWVHGCMYWALEGITNIDLRAGHRAIIWLESIAVMMTIAYVVSMAKLRNTEWTDPIDPRPVHTASGAPLHVDAEAANENEYEYEYVCTWPCVALRAFIAALVGSLALACALSVLHTQRQRQPRRNQPCCDGDACCSCILQLLLVAVLALAAVEGAIGWPGEMPVELLVTAHAAWIYPLTMTVSMLGFLQSWRILARSAFSEEMRQRAEMWDAPWIIMAAAMVFSAWLLGILRHSTVFETADSTTQRSAEGRSSRSRFFMWECIAVSYCGVAVLMYCWNFRRQEARRHACGIVSRTLGLWVPGALLPLLLPAIWDGNSSDPIDRLLGGEGAVYWALVCSPALAAGGFAFEVAYFNHTTHRCDLTVASILVLLLSAGLVTLNHSAF
jgi:hypothetical protein